MNCKICGYILNPVSYIEEERRLEHNHWVRTGRKRYNCSHLECPVCGHKEAVDDDTFASSWFTGDNNEL